MGCDFSCSARAARAIHFNPRTPCGVRLSGYGIPVVELPFQSTHPVWGATACHWSLLKSDLNFNPRTPCGVRRIRQRLWPTSSDFNPRTPCGVRQDVNGFRATLVCISIHAPRVGCDARAEDLRPIRQISIHAPRVGCDALLCGYTVLQDKFQSTHPVWGATALNREDGVILDISIHAPRVGCDAKCSFQKLRHSIFQSTHPVWGATVGGG